MEHIVLYVLDSKYDKIEVMDHYESAIWTDRFDEPGEFELYIPASDKLFSYLKCGAYLSNRYSDHVMIIEQIKIDTDVEDGNKVTVTGRSIESILDRRIIWNQTDFDDANLQNAIKRLLTENVIAPTDSARRISNFIFEDSTDSRITSLKLTAQYNGENNLLDVITDICQTNKIGWKVILNDNKQFVFSLYMGTDRSYAQNTETYVVFSPKFDNFLNSNYDEDEKSYKNVCLIDAEWEQDQKVTRVVGSASGLNRREMHTSGSGVNKKDENDNDIPYATWLSMLDEKGTEELNKNKKKEDFDGECDPYESFVYGKDFFMGDIVQLRNEYGFDTTSRIIEFIFSDDTSDGLKFYPTFKVVEEE